MKRFLVFIAILATALIGHYVSTDAYQLYQQEQAVKITLSTTTFATRAEAVRIQLNGGRGNAHPNGVMLRLTLANATSGAAGVDTVVVYVKPAWDSGDVVTSYNYMQWREVGDTLKPMPIVFPGTNLQKLVYLEFGPTPKSTGIRSGASVMQAKDIYPPALAVLVRENDTTGTFTVDWLGWKD